MQVQGGGVALVIGAYVWNLQLFSGYSDATVGSSNVSHLSGIFKNCSFFKSSASTNTSANVQFCFEPRVLSAIFISPLALTGGKDSEIPVLSSGSNVRSLFHLFYRTTLS
jgi:hypothetical protein